MKLIVGRPVGGSPMLCLWFVIAYVFVAVNGCTRDQKETRYAAEKRLFQAQKMRNELMASIASERVEFLDKTLEQYRGIVADYEDKIGKVDGVEVIVISAQMDIAEIEFRAGMVPEARDDFERVLTLEKSTPKARRSALYSAAYLSESIQEREHSIDLYEQFYGEYLSLDSAMATVLLDTRYLLTPLRLSELSREIGNEYEEALWLQRAEVLYRWLLDNVTHPGPLKDVHLNLLTTLVQQGKWDEALSHIARLKERYAAPADQASIRFIEAKIHQSGKNDHKKASALCRSIYEDFPMSSEAPSALLLDANIHLASEDVAKAEEIYKLVVENYQRSEEACAEAEWQLAQIEEARDDWAEASLRYKSITRKYPATMQGMKAPLQVAGGHEARGETDAARAAYRRAVEEYKQIAANERRTAMRVLAEDYILQVYTRQEAWQDAIDHLLTLPDKYPQYERMRVNYFTAANIYKDELRDREKAIEILNTCIDKYPNSSVARLAEERIELWTQGN
jgi:tetratricopeptide (TPR) repeat protein